jgi:hypothetical protein
MNTCTICVEHPSSLPAPAGGVSLPPAGSTAPAGATKEQKKGEGAGGDSGGSFLPPIPHPHSFHGPAAADRGKVSHVIM